MPRAFFGVRLLAVTALLTLASVGVAEAADVYSNWEYYSVQNYSIAQFRSRIVTNSTTATAYGYAMKSGSCTGSICDVAYLGISVSVQKQNVGTVASAVCDRTTAYNNNQTGSCSRSYTKTGGTYRARAFVCGDGASGFRCSSDAGIFAYTSYVS